MSNDAMVLVTVAHFSNSVERVAELKMCLEANEALGAFGRLVVVVENPDVRDRPRRLWDNCDDYVYLRDARERGVAIVEQRTRPTFAEMYAAALPSDGEIVVLANADIEFDDTVRRVRDVDFLRGGPPDDTSYSRVLAIARHDLRADGVWQLIGDGKIGSHDAWAMKSPCRPFDMSIVIGVNGCDSFLNQRAIEAGCDVVNPCHDILLRHRHASRASRNPTPNGLSYWAHPDYRGTCAVPCDLTSITTRSQ